MDLPVTVVADQNVAVQLKFMELAGVSGELINPNIFLPVNLDRGKTYALEAFFQTSRSEVDKASPGGVVGEAKQASS